MPFDVDAYVTRTRSGGCFICAMLAGDAGAEHELVAQDEQHVAFLSRYPTLLGYTLVAPKAHRERVVGDFDEPAFLAMMSFVRQVAIAVEAVLAPERIYLLSLGSQQGNAHVHWHLAALPPGVPYREQQMHALMAEHGVIATTPEGQADLARRIREALPVGDHASGAWSGSAGS